MTALAFDTLKFARSLRDKARLSNEQAEGFAEAIAEAMRDDLATKPDLQLVNANLKAGIELVNANLKAEIELVSANLKAEIEIVNANLKVAIEASKSEIIKWMFGTIGFQTLVILGAVAALTRLTH